MCLTWTSKKIGVRRKMSRHIKVFLSPSYFKLFQRLLQVQSNGRGQNNYFLFCLTCIIELYDVGLAQNVLVIVLKDPSHINATVSPLEQFLN